MATRIDMPQLGLTMETGTILQWLKAAGQPVEKGQPVVLIQTDKVEYEVESPVSGTLLAVVAKEGQELPVQSLMAIVGQPGEDVSALLAAGQGGAPAPAAPAEAAGPAEAAAPSAAPARAPGERIKISPVARKLAQEHGIDIAALTPTGPEGRIVREDVERAIAGKSREPLDKLGVPSRVEGPSAERRDAADVIPLAGIRKVIFDRMSQSWREAARVAMFLDADATELVKLRQSKGQEWERRLGIRPSYSDLIHMAVARALAAEPRINCRLDGQVVRVRREVNLAFAVDLGEGLVAAVIKQADRKSLGELAKAARDLAERGRAGKLTPDEMADGTFTVTNLGGYGIEGFTPIINQPQAGILGVGRIAEKPVVLNGGIHVRSMVTLSLVFDHRLIDGAPAAKFLAKVKELLEHPTWAE
ncbi:MAG: dihydrolipoamide acetyltransferase family protein [Candidatus Methylomirabilales bacterium]